MNRLFRGAGAALGGTVVGGFVVGRLISYIKTVSRSRTEPKPREGEALADEIHDAGIESDNKNSDNENPMIHETNEPLNVVSLKDEIKRLLEAQNSNQKEEIASLEEKIGEKYMEMQTKLEELEGRSAELRRHNSRLARQINNFMQNSESAINYVVTSVRDQTMELQAFADRLNKLAQENEDLKHRIVSAQSKSEEFEKKLWRKVEQLSKENEDLKNKVEPLEDIMTKKQNPNCLTAWKAIRQAMARCFIQGETRTN